MLGTPDSASGRAKRLIRLGQSLLVLVIFLGAAWLLYREVRQYRYQDIVESLQSLPRRQIGLAIALTVANYLILIGYDLLAIRSIGHPLPLSKVALASFSGHAVSYNFGALLGGTAVRYRLYSAWGLSAVEIVRLVTILAVIFWVGALFLAGAVFVLQPLPIPPELHLPFADVRPLGWGLLALDALWLTLTFVRREPIVIRGRTFILPDFRTSLAQLIVASADLAVAAGVLYALLPSNAAIGYWEFLGADLLGVVAVLFTHVPGGLGVFELVVLVLVAPAQPQAFLAALLVFRVIYYLVPLLIASLLLLVHEVSLRRRPPASAHLPAENLLINR